MKPLSIPSDSIDLAEERGPTLKYRLEYGALRAVEALVSLLPRRAALAVGARLGSIARLLGVRRRVVLKNFHHVGLGTEEQIREWVPELYRNMGRYAVELLRAGRETPPYRIDGEELIDRQTEGGLVLLAHFGNFELMASIFGELLDDANVIVKPQHNPLVEQWLEKRRRGAGVNTIYQRNAVKKVAAVLRRKGIIAALIDQHPGRDGTPVPFLGKETQTVRAMAGLQEWAKTGVASAYAILADDGVYDVVIREEHFELPEDREERISKIQRAHNEIIGAWVREHPTHWFGWFHRRFRPYLDYDA